MQGVKQYNKKFELTQEFAKNLDTQDLLASYRKKFFIPRHGGKDVIYLTGNSLGLQPKNTHQAIKTELDDWANMGVEGHFQGKNPWMHYHKFLNPGLTHILGANENEVVAMNGLTVNLHLMFTSFYKPTKKRYKVLMESGAFPSDMYVLETQAKHHQLDYEDVLIEVKPRDDEHHHRTEDIIALIELHKEDLAMVFLPGVQYYTGQVFDIEKITQKAHEVGAIAGFDLAHAAGNIKLKLHDWQVDWASWCSYKYLNSGPGNVSGVFIHEKHVKNKEMPRLAGWWGQLESERFKMNKGFNPEPGAAGWQLSNAPIFGMAVHKVSLDIFSQIKMDTLVNKRDMLTSYLDFVLTYCAQNNPKLNFQIITPKSRAAQLSILTGHEGKDLYKYLNKNGVISDWREPNVIRMAPVPLYNSFEDIWRLAQILLKF